MSEQGTGALWAAAATGVQVGAAMVATRYVVDSPGPASLGFLRYLVGLLCLAPALLMAPRKHIGSRDLLPIGLLGVGQFGLLIVLLNFSLQHIPAARASLLFATFPVMTMLLSVLLGRESFNFQKAVGALFAFLGVAITLSDATLAVVLVFHERGRTTVVFRQLGIPLFLGILHRDLRFTLQHFFEMPESDFEAAEDARKVGFFLQREFRTLDDVCHITCW